MPVVPFGEFLPDRAALGNPGVLGAVNVVPTHSGYGPVGTLQPVSTALDADCIGALSTRDKDEASQAYAADATKFYRLVGTTWTDASAPGGYSASATDRAEFVKWDNKVLGTNNADDPQQITMGAANFSVLTTAFRAKHIAVVGDFVTFYNTFDATDGAVPNRARWSALGDEEDYTVSPVTLAGFKNLKNAQSIQRGLGGDYGVIITENSTWRQTFVGAPEVFQFDNVLPGVGGLAAGGAVRFGDFVFLWSRQGFLSIINGVQAEYIGAGKVDQFARDDLDEENAHRISSAVDPRFGRVYFGYPGAGSVSGRPNRILVFDITLKRWSLVEQEHEFLFSAFGSAVTVEDLSTLYPDGLDSIPISLDSARFKGGASAIAAFDADNKHGFFDGTTMPAQIDTAERQFHQGRKTRLNAVRPLVDGAEAQLRIATRNEQSESAAFGPMLVQNATGRVPCQLEARYFRFRVLPQAGWSDALGLDFERRDAIPASGR